MLTNNLLLDTTDRRFRYTHGACALPFPRMIFIDHFLPLLPLHPLVTHSYTLAFFQLIPTIWQMEIQVDSCRF